jgi:hypothetical protein
LQKNLTWQQLYNALFSNHIQKNNIGMRPFGSLPTCLLCASFSAIFFNKRLLEYECIRLQASLQGQIARSRQFNYLLQTANKKL